MVDDLLENTMIHAGKDDDLKEGLESSQDLIGIRSHLVDLDVADAVGVLVAAAGALLEADDDVVLEKVLLL